MNPNNNNVEYLLGLPTPRLLNVYRKLRGELYFFEGRNIEMEGLAEAIKEELDHRGHVSRKISNRGGI